MDDYLVQGPAAALDVVEDITGSSVIDVVGLCLGGALTAITAAYLARIGDSRVGSLTLLNTLLDYRRAGPTRPASPTRGPLPPSSRRWPGPASCPATRWPARSMCYGPNDLIFNYVVVKLAAGRDPAGIRHSRLERRQHPDAGQDALLLSAVLLPAEPARAGRTGSPGERLALSDIKNSTYIVGAINDHIVPWPSSYESVHLLGR